jgi:two-component system, chemotaxis family, sensor kinase CheA
VFFGPFIPSKERAASLSFDKLEKVAHVGENLLTRLRDGALDLTPEITTALLGMVDAVRQMLKEIENAGQDGDTDYPELRGELTRLQSAEANPAATAKAAAAKGASPKTAPNPVPAPKAETSATPVVESVPWKKKLWRSPKLQ